jgi:hypothetical protein
MVDENHFTLPSGNVRPIAEVTFDEMSNRFFYAAVDVTDYLDIKRKYRISSYRYDNVRANNESSSSDYVPGSESLFSNFIDQSAKTPFGGLPDVASYTTKMGTIIVIGIVAWLLIQIVSSAKKAS